MNHARSKQSREVVAGEQLRPLPERFYLPSARVVAPLLIGHFLIRQTDSGLAGGLIVETEAYLRDDPACHGFRGETLRNKSMFGPAGRAYVYFIYGNHWCFNAVCQREGIAEAVLIRAIEPVFGLECMSANRPGRDGIDLTNGPAKLCEALGINRDLDGADLTRESSGVFVARNPRRGELLGEPGVLVTSCRVGITKAADWPLRFHFAPSRWVSRRLGR